MLTHTWDLEERCQGGGKEAATHQRQVRVPEDTGVQDKVHFRRVSTLLLSGPQVWFGRSTNFRGCEKRKSLRDG